MYGEKRPHKIYRAGGREFPVYLEYDGQLDESYPAYPDFEKRPEYTDDGRPFATSARESCPYARPKAQGEPTPGDCGGCGFFYREETPYDPIGVCMCDVRRLENKAEKEESR